MSTPTTRLTPDQLRELFLFEALEPDQLQWIAEHGEVVAYPAGSDVHREGDPAECFYVLLSGRLAMSRLVRGTEVETIRSDHRGAYAGAVQFYMRDQVSQKYAMTLRAVEDCEFLTLPANAFAEQFRRWYPMAVHLLQGMFLGSRNNDQIVGQREKLLALGTLSAGLMHELNNPAAAAARATSALGERIAGMRHKLAMLAGKQLDGESLRRLTEIQEGFVAGIRAAPKLGPLETSDREDELGDWLEDRGVTGGWDLAPVFVAGGLGVDELERVADVVAGDFLEAAVRWLAYAVETETLIGEVLDATHRISTLVGDAKQYSQLDRAPHQDVDVHDGLDSTLVMMSGQIGAGIGVVKDYDRSLPLVPAYAGELNQVWTNLVDNAVDAMEGSGTLTVRTARDGERVLVEICDTGPGVPPEIQKQVFEPFFTTKPVGEGTGLGLDVSWRVVVTRHGGDLRLVSKPGDTRFQVRLPLARPAP